MYFLECISSPSEKLQYTEVCRNWGHLIRDTIGYVIKVYQFAEKESVRNRSGHHATLFSLTKHSMDMADGISLLVDQGCGIAAKPLLRSLFEAQLGLRYIRMGDIE